MEKPSVVVVCEPSSNAEKLAEEGRRLSSKMQERAHEEEKLMAELQSVCDELINVEVELDDAVSKAREEEEKDPDVAALANLLVDLKKRVGYGDGDALCRVADGLPWRPAVLEASRRRDEAYEWCGKTVWGRWRSIALPSPLRELVVEDDDSLFTARDEAREVVDVEAGAGEDWLVVDPWRPVDDWEYGDSFEELVDGLGDERQKRKSIGGGWRPLRRRPWARELVRVRIPGAGDLANRVVSLQASSATKQALCDKLLAQITDLQLALAESDERVRRAAVVEEELDRATKDLAESRDALKRNQLLVVASRRTPPQSYAYRKRPVVRSSSFQSGSSEEDEEDSTSSSCSEDAPPSLGRTNSVGNSYPATASIITTVSNFFADDPPATVSTARSTRF